MFGPPLFSFLTAGPAFLKGAFSPALGFSAPLKAIEVSLPLPEIDSDPPAPPFSSVINLATTVITVPDLSINTIRNKIDQFEASDDVFSKDFLTFLVLVGSHGGQKKLIRNTHELGPFLSTLGTKHVAIVDRGLAEQVGLVDGPYMASSHGFHPVRKLFPDRQGAFVASLYLNASTAEASPNMAIAVPSRLYYTVTPEKPLSGLRVAIKDNIDIAGVKTFASSRSYGELYGTAGETAPAIQMLQDLGAIVVGKTGMSQFADAEDPTGDFVDFHSPRNPRGDGLRSPGGSSFGAGAASGAYDWLDFAVATDTGGSVRQPAASQSVFGFRPSQGAVSIDGLVQIHKDLDMVGFLSKAFDILKRVSDEVANTSTIGDTAATPTLIYPAHLFPVKNKAAGALYEKVIASLERVLKVKRHPVNFAEEWARISGNKEGFYEYFAPVLYGYLTWGQYHGRAAFREHYKVKFGRHPYVNPLMQMRWEDGERMSSDEFRGVQRKREEFQSFMETIFGPNTFMITPFKFGEPEARDVYRPAPRERDRAEFAWGLRQAFQSPMAGQPEVVFPVGQLPTISTVSKVEEKYGVIAAITGSRGTDKALLELTDRLLTEMKLPKTVLTGRVPYKE
ncbi:amidase signature domain-containing protein [Schizothecium vesticola]|uniref:Amidase signature domain-containing protein n=1 Tax=Schizothecium vesticola TaxID=314040 RepID=A0AA40BQR8_9PEZI|nr:amidase signature domain-containing protein [Schizothecium vesticola]